MGNILTVLPKNLLVLLIRPFSVVLMHTVRFLWACWRPNIYMMLYNVISVSKYFSEFKQVNFYKLNDI